MTSPLYSELPQELLLDVEPMRPEGEENEKMDSLITGSLTEIKLYLLIS